MTYGLLTVLAGLAIVATGCGGALQGLYAQTLVTPWHLAGYAPTEATGCEGGVAILLTRAAAIPVEVRMTALTGNQVGYFDREAGLIVLGANLGSCAMLEVLSHELGHALEPRVLWGTHGGQVFADGVSYLTVRGLGGYDARDAYAQYLAAMKIAAPTLLLYRVDIERTAGWLITGR